MSSVCLYQKNGITFKQMPANEVLTGWVKVHNYCK